jgi:uncharacterized membrane protein YgdD (TMEM256/DUF423 family)
MNWITAAGFSGFLAVAFGAFGAHALRTRLTPELLAVYQTGVLYHALHAAVLTAVAFFGRAVHVSITVPASLLLAGMFVFSGSLYALALSGQRWLGAITPLGGLCLLAGWLAIGLSLSKA